MKEYLSKLEILKKGEAGYPRRDLVIGYGYPGDKV